MTELKLVTKNNQILADSRDVAEMTGKEHRHLLRDIKNYVEVLCKTNFGLTDFFIESYYTDSQSKPRRHYFLTKKGCDMVANKMTGAKGIEFTAAYVTKFEKMEKELEEVNKPSYMIDDPIKRAEMWIVEQRETKQLKEENDELKPKASYYDMVLQTKSLLSVSKIAKDFGMGPQTLNKMLHELGVQYKQGGTWLLYSKYQDKGYTHSKTHTIDSEKSSIHTYWTQKGRMFIYETLKEKKGILPMIEREENQQLRLVK